MAGLPTKICRRCGNSKSLKEFHRDKSISGGFRHQCKKCRCGDFKKYYKKKKERNPNIWKDHSLKYHKFITVEEYDKLLDAQQGKCAICGKKETVKSRWGTLIRLAIDHDHKTNKVRGLLCYKCNSFLGLANDDTNILFQAINYLRSI